MKIKVPKSWGMGHDPTIEERAHCWSMYAQVHFPGGLTGEMKFLWQLTKYEQVPKLETTDWATFDAGFEYLSRHRPKSSAEFDLNYKAGLALTACAHDDGRKSTAYIGETAACYRNARKILAAELKTIDSELHAILEKKDPAKNGQLDEHVIGEKEFLQALRYPETLLKIRAHLTGQAPIDSPEIIGGSR